MKRTPQSANIFLLFLSAFLFGFSPPSPAKAATVDIMIVYDNTAASWVATNGGMAVFSSEAVNKMNQAMQNSGISGHSFRLVHSMTVNYNTSSDGSSSLSDDLYPLQAGTGVFAPVHSARNDYGADLVAMMVDTGSAYGYVGVGYLLSSWAGSPNYGFTVNAIRSVNISHTLTHEVGHNLGAHHAKTQLSAPGPNTKLDNQYSAGWYFTGTNNVKYHTIMAYNRDGYGGSYVSVPLFSTPLLSHQSTLTGHTDDGDNSRLIRETINAVAGYRDTVTPAYNLTVRSTGASEIFITGSPSTYTGTTNYSRYNIESGTNITLTAPEYAGEAPFSGWSGCDVASATSCTFLMTTDKTVSADYAGDFPWILFLPTMLKQQQ
jgi:hypothetical protein